MAFALSWSGGKDSTLALDRAHRQGLHVQYLFNIYDGASGRVRFHGVRKEMIAAQADSLGLELVQRPTAADDFESVFLTILDELAQRGANGVIFGNIHLTDVRRWYDERTTAKAFRHVEPLWGERPADLIVEFVGRGYRGVVVSIDVEQAEARWLGREIDDELIGEILSRPGVDPCGERGEFHSFVYDGPLFRMPLALERGEAIEMEGHRLLDLVKPQSGD